MLKLPILLLLGLVQAQTDCSTCLKGGKTYCLNDKTLQGTCCPEGNCKQTKFDFCSSTSTMANAEDWICPTNGNFCPIKESDVHLDISSFQQATYQWDFMHRVPLPQANGWRCKNIIRMEDKFYDAQLKEAGSELKKFGYLFVQTEQYGFDENVTLYIQNREGGELQVFHNEKFGAKFFIPAEMQIMVQYEPEKNVKTDTVKVQSNSGKMKIRSYYVAALKDADKALLSSGQAKEVKRPGGSEEAEPNKEQQVTHNCDPTLLVGQPQGSVFNWQCEIIKPGKWYEKKLFTIGQYDVTKGQAAGGSTVLMIVIGAIIGICVYVSFDKRKEIAETGRRMTASLRRSDVQEPKEQNTEAKTVNQNDQVKQGDDMEIQTL